MFHHSVPLSADTYDLAEGPRDITSGTSMLPPQLVSKSAGPDATRSYLPSAATIISKMRCWTMALLFAATTLGTPVPLADFSEIEARWAVGQSEVRNDYLPL